MRLKRRSPQFSQYNCRIEQFHAQNEEKLDLFPNLRYRRLHIFNQGAFVDQPTASTSAVPRLRGLLHLISAPASFMAGLLLIWSADTTAARVACGVFVLTALNLFGISATYHRGECSVKTKLALRRRSISNAPLHHLGLCHWWRATQRFLAECSTLGFSPGISRHGLDFSFLYSSTT